MVLLVSLSEEKRMLKKAIRNWLGLNQVDRNAGTIDMLEAWIRKTTLKLNKLEDRLDPAVIEDSLSELHSALSGMQAEQEEMKKQLEKLRGDLDGLPDIDGDVITQEIAEAIRDGLSHLA